MAFSTGDGAAGEGAGAEFGEVFAQAGHAQAVAGSGPDDGGEDRGEEGVHDGVHAADLFGAVAEESGVGEQGQAEEDGDGEGAADPGGGDGAGHGFAGDAQMTARSMRPPSRGRPGRRLKKATRRFEIIRPARRTPGTVAGSTAFMPR